MKTRLDQIEAHLRRLIESSVLLLPWSRREHLLARRLVEALHESVHSTDTGSLSVPGIYTIFLNPDTLAYWQSQPEVVDALAQALQEAVEEAGVRFVTPPLLRLAEDRTLGPDEVAIVPVLSFDHTGSTASLSLTEERRARRPTDTRPQNAFLIINGEQTFPLQQAVVNIGRRRENHLVLDDPRVSRNHAQLRVVRGQYVLFDLNSTGGTFVNGLRITQHPLKPGDVISLAGVPLIYGEEAPSRVGDTDEWSLGPLTSRSDEVGE